MAANTAFVAILRDAAKRPLLRMRQFRLADQARTVIIASADTNAQPICATVIEER
jgi:hypothetical protein